MPSLHPGDISEVREAVAAAGAVGDPLEIVGGGSKRGLGRPVESVRSLALDRIAGIVEYTPAELVITARAGTRLDHIEGALAAQGQMFAFEPHWPVVAGSEEPAAPTIGGIIACNISGPRRIKAGAARDHFLGFHAVNGRGEIFKAGGKVLKNVTGYDLCKLLAGSFGTLAVMTEVTVKVLPRPETTRTVVVLGLDDARAIVALGTAIRSPHEVTAAAHVPQAIVRGVRNSPDNDTALTAVRVEGFSASVATRSQAVVKELANLGTVVELDEAASQSLWNDIAAATPLRDTADCVLWRISVAPARGAAVVEAVQRSHDITYFYDWAGGLIWMAVASAADGGQGAIRAAIVAAGGGHATLIKAPADLRQRLDVFEPQPAALAALGSRVKTSFDPERVLNRGRIYAGL